MKQNLTLIGSIALGSALFVILMWAPFTYPLSLNQVIKHAAIGAIMGLVFYLIGLRKRVSRRATTRKAGNFKPASQKRRTKV